MDTDNSGCINKAEFKSVMERILLQTVGRMVTQFGLTILCPMTATHVCAAMRYLVASAMAMLALETPSMLVELGANLPDSLDETITAGAMMLAINPALAVIDSLSTKRAL